MQLFICVQSKSKTIVPVENYFYQHYNLSNEKISWKNHEKNIFSRVKTQFQVQRISRKNFFRPFHCNSEWQNSHSEKSRCPLRCLWNAGACFSANRIKETKKMTPSLFFLFNSNTFKRSRDFAKLRANMSLNGKAKRVSFSSFAKRFFWASWLHQNAKINFGSVVGDPQVCLKTIQIRQNGLLFFENSAAI